MDTAMKRLLVMAFVCLEIFIPHIAASVAFSMSGSDIKSDSYDIEPVWNDIDGVIVNTGGTGKGETNIAKQHDDLEHSDDVDDDGDLEDLQEDFEKWLRSCTTEDGIPDITESVSQFLVRINMTKTEMLKECEDMKNKNTRGRRFLLDGAGIWDKCIIPFVFDESFGETARKSVTRVHNMFRLKSGFRFVETKNANDELGLGHKNYLNYHVSSNCESLVGNYKRWKTGQNIAACSYWSINIHEIGHALGFKHEHQDPAAIEKLMLFNYDNIQEGEYNQYSSRPRSSVHLGDMFYDLTSKMHYGQVGTYKGYGKMMLIDDPELTELLNSPNYYYMLKETQNYHNCFAQFKCEPNPVCKMDGYRSIVNDICTCTCPEGLEPTKSCEVLKERVPSSDWPEGTYSLLKVKGYDCPKGFTFGQMARWNDKKIWSEGEYLSGGVKGDYEIVFDACTKTSPEGKGEWQPGEYCILKKGNCPKGFKEGLMKTLGKVPAREDSSVGALPDGKKGQDFEFRFCCREDGHATGMSISLPNTEPFILYTTYAKSCQKIEGMVTAARESYLTSYDTSKTLAFTGFVPAYWKNTAKDVYKTYYCVYLPANNEKYQTVYTNEHQNVWYSILYAPCGIGELKNALTGSTSRMSPGGTTMKIEFSDFEVSTVDDDHCKSYVELKTVMPGMTGFKICGHHDKKPRITVYNRLVVKFSSSVNEPQKGFSAIVTVLKETDQCYKGEGKTTYAGKVDYSRSLKPCVPWTKVKNCALNQFSTSGMDLDLSHNYCRTVRTGRMPWCYVNAELCEREICDGCMRDGCYDVLPNCKDIVQEDCQFCKKNDLSEAKRGCMKTCGFCEDQKQLPAYPTVRCSVPEKVTGISPCPIKLTYHVGDEVSYECPTSKVVRNRTCLGDGTWSHLGYVCSGCQNGWTYVLGRCYKVMKDYANYDDAKKTCESLDSRLAIVDSDAQFSDIMGLTFYDRKNNHYFWMGLSYQNDKWQWDDSTENSYLSWWPGYPKRTGRCIAGGGPHTLFDDDCTTKRQVMCSQTLTGCKSTQSKLSQWVNKVTSFSSQYTTEKWSADQIIGPPNVYPSYGDDGKAWASLDKSTSETIEVEFLKPVYATCIDIYETYYAGGVKRVSARNAQTKEWTVLWKTDKVLKIEKARIFNPAIPEPTFKTQELRIELDQSVAGSWVELDAIQLHGSEYLSEFVCEDDLPHCGDILAKNPEVCEAYPSYAWIKCRKTCGVKGCKGTSTCTVPTVANAQQIHGPSDSVNQGQYVEFKCKDGFLLKSGNLNRTCLSTGSFNGDPLLCTAPGDVSSVTLFSDVQLFRRKHKEDSYMNYAETANLDSARITVAGKITAWTFFASQSGELTFLVWRPNANDETQFTLIGKNTLTVTADNRAVIMEVGAESQILAQKGDLIGFVMPVPVLTYSWCEKTRLTQYDGWMTTTEEHKAADMTVGKTFTLKKYRYSCRIYSIHVTITPSG